MAVFSTNLFGPKTNYIGTNIIHFMIICWSYQDKQLPKYVNNTEKLFLSKTLLKDSSTYWLFQTPANTFLMFSFFFLCECQIRLCRFSWAFGGMYIQSHFKRVMMYQQLLLEPNSEKNTLVSLERPKDYRWVELENTSKIEHQNLLILKFAPENWT